MGNERSANMPTRLAAYIPRGADALDVLRQALELQREGDTTLDVEGIIEFASANPGAEVVDSIGAVSVVCILYGAYGPQDLIPARLLTHENFSTLGGLTKVMAELSRKGAGK